jgi:hypothetical protein
MIMVLAPSTIVFFKNDVSRANNEDAMNSVVFFSAVPQGLKVFNLHLKH